jgi:hypothetical protein
MKGFFAGLAFTLAVISGYLAAVMLIAAAALVLAPSAHASSNAFGGGTLGDHDAYALWSQLVTIGAPANESIEDAQNFANRICGQRDSGSSEGALVYDAYTNYQIPVVVASLAIQGAEFHFCPWNYS